MFIADAILDRRFLAFVAFGCSAYVARELSLMCSEKPWSREEHGYERHPPYGNFPDLRRHNNLMASQLTPEIYESLRYQTTSRGFTFDQAIQVGVDNRGLPWQHQSGIIAGDEQSYHVFAPLFDAIIEKFHGHGRKDYHSRDLDSRKIIDGHLSDGHVLSVRLHARRSIRGFGLPAACSRGERRTLEGIIRLVLMRMGGEFEGKYLALCDFPDPSLGSLNVSSYPTAPLITCSGRARDWPESRGLFRNKNNTFVVFVNEDDHVQFRCFEKGGDMKGVFGKLVRGIAAFERELKRSGEEFIWDDHLGYIVSDPVHLGTALDVRMRVRLRHLSADPRLRWILTSFKLERKRSGISEMELRSGVMYIHTTRTLGVTEVDIVQRLCDGVNRLIEIERMLERGEDIQDALPAPEVPLGPLNINL